MDVKDTHDASHTTSALSRPVIDLARFREKKNEDRRKNNERILFNNLLSVYLITAPTLMRPVRLIEVSTEGCSFEATPWNQQGGEEAAEEATLRLYFSPSTFLELNLLIKSSMPTLESQGKVNRLGCLVNPNQRSFEAYKRFVQFLKAYGVMAVQDRGEIRVSHF